MIRLQLLLLIATTLSCKSQKVGQDVIVLINVERLDRAGIANELSIINSFNPKVVAIDLQFSQDTEYDKDIRLMQSLDKCKNLIMVSIIKGYTGEDVPYTSGFDYGSLPNFTTNAKTGFANTILEKDDFQTIRKFSTVENMDGYYQYHFGVRVAMAFDSLKAVDFIKNNPRIVDIDYQGEKRNFKIFSASQVLDKKVSRKDIEGKIVMVGFLGPGDEDKFFTPLNKKRDASKPDMYGIECWAHVVAQVLE